MPSPRILTGASPSDILLTARMLREGGVVAVPTDTVYGLACSVFQADSVKRVYELKRRTREKQVPVLLATAADLPILADDPPRVVWTLIDSFWPGPLTLVLRAAPLAPASVVGPDRTVGVRVPASATCLALLQSLGEPVVGTSANLSGQEPLLTATEVLRALPDVDGVLEADGEIRAGVPSTILRIADSTIEVLRRGAIAPDSVRAAVGPTVPVLEEPA